MRFRVRHWAEFVFKQIASSNPARYFDNMYVAVGSRVDLPLRNSFETTATQISTFKPESRDFATLIGQLKSIFSISLFIRSSEEFRSIVLTSRSLFTAREDSSRSRGAVSINPSNTKNATRFL